MQTLRVIPLRLAAALLGGLTFTMRRGLASGMRRRFGHGFRPLQRLSPDELFLSKLDLCGKTIFDIGAYIGIYGLFFGRAAGASGRVICFEPNPHNYHELLANLGLNQLPQVAALPIGIGSGRARVELLLDPSYPARGFVAGARPDQSQDRRSVHIEITSVDQLLATGHVPEPDFVKIDVEGLELDVLYGMAGTITRRRPELFIEVHYAIPELLPLLHGAGYRVYMIEDARWLDPGAAPVPWGHVYCTVSGRHAA